MESLQLLKSSVDSIQNFLNSEGLIKNDPENKMANWWWRKLKMEMGPAELFSFYHVQCRVLPEKNDYEPDSENPKIESNTWR